MWVRDRLTTKKRINGNEISNLQPPLDRNLHLQLHEHLGKPDLFLLCKCIYIHAYSLLSSSQYPRLLISVQAVVFKALTVIFRDLFYLYFIKGISLQRTNKRSVPNLNVRNPVLRGYKQISCPAVKSLLLNCFFCLVSYTAQGTLAFEGLCLPFPRRDRVGHHRTCSPEDGWTAGPGDSWPLGYPKCICHQVVERSITWGAADIARLKHTMSYRTTLKGFVFNPAIKIPIF